MKLLKKSVCSAILLQLSLTLVNPVEARGLRYSWEQPENFTENSNNVIKNLLEMEQNRNLPDNSVGNLLQGSVKNQPWSGDYWALANGLLAHRYADPSMHVTGGFLAKRRKFKKKKTAEYVVYGKQNILSPAEKYDLLLGPATGQLNLTEASWRESKAAAVLGQPPGWMGICHGWAPASYLMPRPVRPVTVTAFNGKPITFYPHDLKALGSLLWARAKYKTIQNGKRCFRRLNEDSNRRVSQYSCFDTNPAAWHMAAVNQMGIARSGFVIDDTFDKQVWNQPVKSYSYKYRNLRSGAYTSKLRGAINTPKKVKNKYYKGAFKRKRAKGTSYIVGIEMNVTYMNEVDPCHNCSADATKTVVYKYGLELDGNYNIIGGEWLDRHHPDFIWRPITRNVRASHEHLVGSDRWSPKSGSKVPSNMRNAAIQSARNGQPLAAIVNALFAASL